MTESIEEETETPPNFDRFFQPYTNKNMLTSYKGKAIFDPKVICDMHE